ncbi:MAG: metalloregulator ArsR/SmtB family transcription factor [Vicinamibacterales bacterium]
MTTNHVSDAFAALADPTRRDIFERIARQPSAVGDLARQLPVSRPAVSQHLKVLKTAGLVVDSRDGTRRIYAVDPTTLAAVRQYFDTFWILSLSRFKAAAEKRPRPRHA